MKKNNPNCRTPRKKKPSFARRFLRGLLRWTVILCNICIKCLFLLPIPLFLLWYSYTVDRNGWFQGEQYEREVAQAMLAGENISHFEKMEEREIIKLYAQNLAEPLEVISIGSSRVLQLTAEIAGSDSFFNAGMIGSEQPDVMSSYYLFDRADKIPETVIFEVDPWIFSSSEEALTYTRVDKAMYSEFLHYGLGHTDVEVAPAEKNMNFWVSLTSPAFFRENLEYYIENKESGTRPQVVEGDVYKQDTEIKMADGSVLYPPSMRDADQLDIDNTALTAINNSFIKCEGFETMDPELCGLFDEFIRYMQQKGSRVILLLTPYHPIVYDRVLEQPERYSGFFEVETWLRDYAQQNGLALYGSYDPEAVGCENTDFYDGWHVRGEGIAKYFPGVDNCVPYTAPADGAGLHRLPDQETAE